MIRRRALLPLVLLLLVLTGCSQKPEPRRFISPDERAASPTVPAERAGTVIFDMAHGEVFGPDDTSALGQSELVKEIEAEGYQVQVNRRKFDDVTLSDVAAVYVPGPMTPFTDAEKKVLDDYVVNGGTIVLTIHVPFPVMATPARWGLPVGSDVMVDRTPAYDDPGIFAATGMTEDALTEGIESVVVVSGWPVSVDSQKLAGAKIAISSPDDIAVDANKNGAFDAADPQPPYGVVGIAPVGSGRVIVMGDDAIFANIAIHEANNLQLLKNILGVIAAPKGA